MGAYPKAKYRALAAGEVGDIRNPGYVPLSNPDLWPYRSVVVNSATEEANLDPTFTWVDDPSLLSADANQQPYP